MATVLEQQLLPFLSDPTLIGGELIVAYEPVWAIGTGLAATVEQVQAVHAFIRKAFATVKAEIGARLPILYGGSVTPENAEALFTCPDVDGGLVGGASLKVDGFLGIIRCFK